MTTNPVDTCDVFQWDHNVLVGRLPQLAVSLKTQKAATNTIILSCIEINASSCYTWLHSKEMRSDDETRVHLHSASIRPRSFISAWKTVHVAVYVFIITALFLP